MNEFIILNQPVYPHKRREQWSAPSIEVAQRWADEAAACGHTAKVCVRYNATVQQYYTEVWITVEQPA